MRQLHLAANLSCSACAGPVTSSSDIDRSWIDNEANRPDFSMATLAKVAVLATCQKQGKGDLSHTDTTFRRRRVRLVPTVPHE
jgi:hypothetical protein